MSCSGFPRLRPCIRRRRILVGSKQVRRVGARSDSRTRTIERQQARGVAMDVRRQLSRFGSLSIILVLSLAVLAACGREENAKPTATPTGGAAVGTIEAPLGTTEAGGAEGTVEALASEANPAVEGTAESGTGAVEGSVEAVSETVQAEPAENGSVIGAI